jgi:outer membrane lipoprotein-sorting protein
MTAARRSSTAASILSGAWAVLIAASGALLAPCAVANAEESSAAILAHARSVYEALNSYADSGTVLYEYTATSHDEHHFTTAFNRAPRRFLLDFHKGSGDRIVISGDPDAFHVWWKATGQTTEYPNPKNAGAITLSDFPTNAVATKIPPLLYAKAGLPGAIAHFVPEDNVVPEACADKKCYRLQGTTGDTYGATGRQVNVRKLSVWVEEQTYLIRKVIEDAPAAAGTLNRTTTTFIPQANPTLDDDAFKFTVPK